ncbi:MAG: hypothetical protein QOI20_3474 [Acidimicrobiaceae bacterium]|nr:hypothetical protein [Acidimicrobiaceae bacterium]
MIGLVAVLLVEGRTALGLWITSMSFGPDHYLSVPGEARILRLQPAWRRRCAIRSSGLAS